MHSTANIFYDQPWIQKKTIVGLYRAQALARQQLEPGSARK